MLEFEPRSLWLDHHPLASELSFVLLYRVHFYLIGNLASSPVSDVSLWSRPAAGESARLWKRGDIFGPHSARGLLSNLDKSLYLSGPPFPSLKASRLKEMIVGFFPTPGPMRITHTHACLWPSNGMRSRRGEKRMKSPCLRLYGE